MKYLAFLLFFLSFSNTTSCNTNSKVFAKKNETKDQSVQKAKFFISNLNGKDISEEKLYIIFDEESSSASGFSGCNTFLSKYSIHENTISLDFPISTKMYCEKNAELEKAFLKALILTKIRILKNDSLFLKDNNHKVLFSGVKTKE